MINLLPQQVRLQVIMLAESQSVRLTVSIEMNTAFFIVMSVIHQQLI